MNSIHLHINCTITSQHSIWVSVKYKIRWKEVFLTKGKAAGGSSLPAPRDHATHTTSFIHLTAALHSAVWVKNSLPHSMPDENYPAITCIQRRTSSPLTWPGGCKETTPALFPYIMPGYSYSYDQRPLLVTCLRVSHPADFVPDINNSFESELVKNPCAAFFVVVVAVAVITY